MEPKALIDGAIGWVTAVLRDPQDAAARFQARAAPWRQTAAEVTVPVNLLAVALSYILTFLIVGFVLGFFWSIAALLWAVATFFIAAFLFDYFAGAFGGVRSFDQSFAMLTLAGIPAALGSLLQVIPWIGWLLSLAASVYSLVLLYQFAPTFLKVPEDKRVVHFIVSLLACGVTYFIVAMLIGMLATPELMRQTASSDATSSTVPGGVLGGIGRQAEIADRAQADTYDAPADGKLSGKQVRSYADTLRRTSELRQRLSKRFDEGEEPTSITDVFGGVGDAMRMTTAEMEVVKGAGGNWAEHQWVRNQIEIARVQKDLNPAVEHNYELFLEHRDDIEKYD